MLTAETEADLKKMIHEPDRGLTAQGMKINTNKTHEMLGANTPPIASPVVLDGQTLREVTRFKYCGG